MPIDATRAAFIKNEYRYATAQDAAVLGRDKGARLETIKANVDETTASELAQTILAQNNTPRMITVTLDGILRVSDFIGGVPRYILNIGDYNTDGRTWRVISATFDPNNGTTSLRLHG